MSTEKLSYSQLAGELRKQARLYEVFKEASKAADILASFDKEIKELEKNKSFLEQECEELDEACNAAVEKAQKAEHASNAAKNTQDIIIAEATKKANEIIRKAKQAEEVLQKNILEQEALAKKRMEGLESDIKQIVNRRNDAEKLAVKAEEKVKEIKSKFLDSLN